MSKNRHAPSPACRRPSSASPWRWRPSTSSASWSPASSACATLRLLDRALAAVPGLGELYRAWKHITVTPDGSGVFSRVALVPDLLGGWTIAFTSGRPVPGTADLTCVFLPAAPNPTSGRLCLVPTANCRLVNVSPEEAFKMILSGGNYVPDGIGTSAAAGSNSANSNLCPA